MKTGTAYVGAWLILPNAPRTRWPYGCHLRRWISASLLREMTQWCGDTFSHGRTRDLDAILRELFDSMTSWEVQGQTTEVMIQSAFDIHYVCFAREEHRVAFLLRWSDLA